MSVEPRWPSEEAMSKALGAFNALNSRALELAVTNALMRNEGALKARANAAASRQRIHAAAAD